MKRVPALALSGLLAATLASCTKRLDDARSNPQPMTGDRAAVAEDLGPSSSREFPLEAPLSRVPFLMAHDAATTYRHDYSLPAKIVATQVQTQQEGGFTSLLNCGVRAFDVRPCYTHAGQLYMHHGDATIKRPLADALREIIDWAGSHRESLIIAYVSHCGGGVGCTGGPATSNQECESATAELLRELGITMLHSVDISYGEALERGRLSNGGLVLALEQVRENYDESIQYCAGLKVKASAFADLFAYMDRIAALKPSGSALVITQAHWQDPDTTLIDGCAESVLRMESASKINSEIATRISSGRWPYINLLEVDNACDQRPGTEGRAGGPFRPAAFERVEAPIVGADRRLGAQPGRETIRAAATA